ncbi:hypothetical protein SAV14893_090590 [Streptomyces avermitilis]|uniref:DUF2267 domain-containing protein n=1 Tax=Streptomyces avermitilis TaxID=33903 RepID=A0A4D4MCY0_STRAX|nr:hypothetical protein SAV14893_090590 [Streptomyces avermitilis]
MVMRWEAFLHQVKERGDYETTREAERAARTVLALLGAHLVGEVRAELAARLPESLALVLLNPLQAREPLSPSGSSGLLRHGSREPPNRPRPGT